MDKRTNEWTKGRLNTDESEIQEVNPPKTVAPPPLQPQPQIEERRIRWGMEAYINTISLIRAILEFHSQSKVTA